MPSTRELLGTPPWTAPHAPASVPLPRSCEVLVVGAGVTGLSAALALASEGRDVVIVDRRFGSGAACRSGGIIVGDTLIGPAPGFEGCDLELRDWVSRACPGLPAAVGRVHGARSRRSPSSGAYRLAGRRSGAPEPHCRRRHARSGGARVSARVGGRRTRRAVRQRDRDRSLRAIWIELDGVR